MADTPLKGLLVSLKDNIHSASEPTTCASKILAGYRPTHPSTVSTLLHNAGAIVSGKTNLDEFGMGSHSRPPSYGPVLSHLSPANESSEHSTAAKAGSLSAGGSSGGSAVAVATGQCFAALGTDTGGSVRLPAAWTGTVGFKPSYGRVSRWGVVDYANSLDTVGVLTRSVADAEKVFGVIDGFDAKDGTSLSKETRRRMDEVKKASGKLRVGVPVDWNVAGLAPEVKAAWVRVLDRLQDMGHTLHPVSLPTTPLALGAYYILAPAEASSNLARYDGIRYGHRAEGVDYADTRAAFGAEVRRRILLGTYTLSAAAMENYFLAAQKVRRAVQQDFDAAFRARNVLLQQEGHHVAEREEGVDVLIGPTVLTLPPALKDVAHLTSLEAYTADALTVPASLAGLPALSVPVSVPGLSRNLVDGIDTRVWSAGMQIVGQFGHDETVLQVGALVEDLGKQ